VPEGSLTVGVLSPLLAGAYFGEILNGTSRYVAGRGGRVVALQTLDAELGDHYPGVPPFDSEVAWDAVDGFIVIVQAVSSSFISRLLGTGKPVVVVSHHVEGASCVEVRPDNRSGVVDAVEHLVGHGHARIGFVGDLSFADVRERHDAYRATLVAHGLPAGPELFFPAPNNCEDGGQEAGRLLLAAGTPCSAVVAATDLNALGLVQVLSEAGVPVPSQLAVVGFDDMEFASRLDPPLASIRQNFDVLSATAAGLLLDMVGGAHVEPGEHRVRTTFVPRASCGCQDGMTPALAQLEEAGGDAIEQATRRLWARLAEPALPRAAYEALKDALSRLLGASAEAASGREPGGLAVKEAASEIYELFPRPETVTAVMDALADQRGRLLRAGYSSDRLAALDSCSREAFTVLNRAQMRSLARSNESLQASLRNEYYVSMGLMGLRIGQEGLRSQGVRPKSLEWLAGTEARSACLALWASDSGPRAEAHAPTLRTASVYGQLLAERVPLGGELDLRHFPPVGPLTEGFAVPEDVVFVLPVRTSHRDWGMLAVTGPPESAAKTGRDIYFQWAALLGIALDHEALVHSLERQREDLADAYSRARGLVAELRASEERYALAACAANDGLWDWDLVRQSVFYSSRWKSMLGYAEGEIGDAPSEWLDRAHPDDRRSLEAAMDTCTNGEGGPLQVEVRMRAKDGTYRWCLCRATAVRPEGRPATRLVGSLTDISERKDLEDRLLHAALYDSLTGLPNRSLFMDRMRRAFGGSRRLAEPCFCVLFMDLDGFKVVNDTLGHVFGDLLLVQVAERVAAHLRESDTAVRFGGDEFAVLLDGVTGPQQVDLIVGRLSAALALPYEIEGRAVQVSATIGTAYSTKGYSTPEEMIHDADLAMYKAKRAKRAVAGASMPAAPVATAARPFGPTETAGLATG